MAEVWGYPCARERSDGPLPLSGAAAPSLRYPGGVRPLSHTGPGRVRRGLIAALALR